MANIIVSGAGSTEVNGTYVENGELGGRPYYENGDYAIGWDAGWLILNITELIFYYIGEGNVATPDLCTKWELDESGELPVPTVTKEGETLTGIPKHFLYYARLRGN